MANKLHTMRFNLCLIAFVMLVQTAGAQTAAKEKGPAYLTPKDSVFIVIDEGQIVGEGTHKELYKENKLYRELYEKELTENIKDE